jgi:hypothetical protein
MDQKVAPVHAALRAPMMRRDEPPAGNWCDVCGEIADHWDTSSLMFHNDRLREREQAERERDQRIIDGAATKAASLLRGERPSPRVNPPEQINVSEIGRARAKRMLKTLEAKGYVPIRGPR